MLPPLSSTCKADATAGHRQAKTADSSCEVRKNGLMHQIEKIDRSLSVGRDRGAKIRQLHQSSQRGVELLRGQVCRGHPLPCGLVCTRLVRFCQVGGASLSVAALNGGAAWSPASSPSLPPPSSSPSPCADVSRGAAEGRAAG
jgi:hypothetical protein|eukprot:SAG25_NODE_337_length_9543_cov_4.171961_9_plen_143_part_00